MPTLDFPDNTGYPGIVYFTADPTPAPVPLDQATMVLTSGQRRAYQAAFRRDVLPHVRALLTTSLHAVQATDFLQRYPDARRKRFSFMARLYWGAAGARPPG
jgi:hypothetical protein